MYRGEHVDILYGNVKHAFFQVKLSLYFLAQIKFRLSFGGVKFFS